MRIARWDSWTVAPVRPLSLLLLAFATIGASHALVATTRGSFDRPPYYHGKLSSTVGPIAHVAVFFRDDPQSLDPTPGRSPALLALLDSLRVELDRIGLTRELAQAERVARDAPIIRFGAPQDGVGDEGPRRMSFEVEDPGRGWKTAATGSAGDSIHAILVVQVGFSEHWVRQTNWKGRKSIEIGTAREIPVPWLTSLDDPVQVLQLTGAIVTPAGKVLRVGAEGLLARRTGMVASVLGAQEVLTEEDLSTLATPTPDGIPLWRVALRSLVTGLLAGSSR